MNRKLGVIVSFFCIIFSQCSDPVSTSGPVSDIFPMKPGNNWKYVIHENFYGKDRIIDTLTVEITKDMAFNFNGKSYTAAIHQKKHGEFIEDLNWLLSNGENGIYQCGGISTTDTLFRRDLIYKNPVSKGESWSVPFIEFDFYSQKFLISETLNFDCYSTNDSLVTPAGTFLCTVYHFKRHPAEDVMEYWDYFEYYAPNIGKVGTIIRRAESGELIYKYVLISYDIK